ncbi:MAG: osmoprotectant NAGGN system M42 family peptidase [Alphaproteobacteria bacterium]|nr:osmoprotectant NAGGN system M42 family peptidase [Alphaproteobacteria bacterium]
MKDLNIDLGYLRRILSELLEIPSPTGMTDLAVVYVCDELKALGIPFELTRRGAIRADLKGRRSSPDRAIVTHVDTLGAIIKGFHPANGWPRLSPVGHWSARFAEGARCTVYSDDNRQTTGTILPLKASGHTYGDEIDIQPSTWENLELRLDARVSNEEEIREIGINVGDMIAVHPMPYFAPNGFICSRHLDNKAGVAAKLAAAKAILESGVPLPMDCHLLFTISEEVGVGASHVLHGDVAELLSVDNGTIASVQYTCDYGVTIAMQDSTGPFDWHLTRSLISLCKKHSIDHSRDVFNHYRSDSAAALEAGNDIRTALVCFGLDASHGFERTHMDSLHALSRLLALYMQSPALFERDEKPIGPVGDFPATD